MTGLVADAEKLKPPHPRDMELLGIVVTFVGIAFLAALPLLALLKLTNHRER